ncbi:GDSL esterase/lipase, partial [Striga hermonthica]
MKRRRTGGPKMVWDIEDDAAAHWRSDDGDSIYDTGNLIREVPIGASTPFARLPYGRDFHWTPTDRCSNGLLMIDFIARASGLPLLHAYKDPNGEFSNGVNFAMAGSTALSCDTLAAMH